MHICVCAHTHTHECVWVHMPRPKANIECLLLLTTFIFYFILFFKTRSLTESAARCFRLPSQQDPRSGCVCPFLQLWDCKCTQQLCGIHNRDFMLAQEALCPLSHPQAHPLDIPYFISFPNLFCSLYLCLLQSVVNVMLHKPSYKNLVARCGVALLQSQEIVP